MQDEPRRVIPHNDLRTVPLETRVIREEGVEKSVANKCHESLRQWKRIDKVSSVCTKAQGRDNSGFPREDESGRVRWLSSWSSLLMDMQRTGDLHDIWQHPCALCLAEDFDQWLQSEICSRLRLLARPDRGRGVEVSFFQKTDTPQVLFFLMVW